MKFVTSWDDGHPSDLRLASLLEKYGVRGTFFVPGRNNENRPVMDVVARRDLDARFELGSHTLEHIYLDRLSAADARCQIEAGKIELEQQLGHSVAGFCYPGGRWNADIRAAVEESGFSYGRTTQNFRVDQHFEPYIVPVTLQFYPHRTSVLLRNFASRGQLALRFETFFELMRASTWQDRLERLVKSCHESDSVLHIWGHSWEIDENCLWDRLEKFLSLVATTKPRMLTVGELIAAREFAR